MPRGRGTLRANLALGAAAMMAALAAGEVVFRLFGLGPPRAAPGAGAVAPETSEADERRNSMGFRGPEWPLEKAPGSLRALFLGDSFTYGRGVPEERIFTSVAAAELSRPGRPVEALNMSKPGWDTLDEITALEQTGLTYRPDVVVVTFFLNDATRLDSNPVIAWRLNRELNDRDGLLNRISRLYDTTDYILRKRRVTRETLQDYRESYLGSPGRRAAWERCRGALVRGAEICRGEGIGLAVVIFPMLVELGEGYAFRDVHETVAGACREAGIPALDLLSAFAGRDGPSLWVSPDNAHPNAEGHAIAGRAIAAFLRASGLDRPRTPAPAPPAS